MARQTTTITDGPAGSGKSLTRCACFLTEEFLPEDTGVHCSNFPIFGVARDGQGETYAERIGAYVAKTWGGDADEYRERLKQIPHEVEATWRTDVEDGGSGPWDWFKETDITGWHIAIDEGHTVCGKHHSIKHRKRWMEFLGELRHRGATIEFVSQDVHKLAKEIDREAGTLYTLVNASQRRDPLFRIAMQDWYEVRALFTRKFVSSTWQLEHRKQKGRWIHEQTRQWPLVPKYFAFYDSYDAPKSGGQAATNPPLHEFEKRGPLGLGLWFLGRNYWAIAPRLAMAAGVAYVTVGGGGEMLLGQYFGALRGRSLAAKERIQNAAGKPVRPATQSAATKPKPLRPPAGPGRPNTGAADAPVVNALPVKRNPADRVCGVTPWGVLVVEGFEVKIGEYLQESNGDAMPIGLLDEVQCSRGRYRVDGVWCDLKTSADARESVTIPEPVRGGSAVIEPASPDRGPVANVSSRADEPASVLPAPSGTVGQQRRLGPDTRPITGDPFAPKRLGRGGTRSRGPQVER